MNISENLKNNLVADVVNTIGCELGKKLKVELKRAFEITIGTHLKQLNEMDNISQKQTIFQRLPQHCKLLLYFLTGVLLGVAIAL